MQGKEQRLSQWLLVNIQGLEITKTKEIIRYFRRINLTTPLSLVNMECGYNVGENVKRFYWYENFCKSLQAMQSSKVKSLMEIRVLIPLFPKPERKTDQHQANRGEPKA